MTRLSLGLLLGAVALVATLASGVRPAAADEGTDAVAQLLRNLQQPAAASLSATGAQAVRAEILQQLGDIQVSVQKCNRFLERFGQRPAVARVLQRIQTEPPGRGLFTSPETISELERIAGKSIDLGQRDLELCVQLRDNSVGAAPDGEKPASLSAIGARLGKCLSALGSIGPNPAVVAQLRRLSRGIGDATFTSQARLAALERAAGRNLGLTVRDFETCVDAYDTKTALTALTSVGVSLGSAIDCPPPGELCQGTLPGNQICCTGTFNLCAQSCDEDECLPYCEPCFPSDATVSMEDGSSKRMTELRIGDRVAVIRPDGSRGFDDIYLFTHKDQVTSAPYVTLTLESGRELSLSPRQFIPVATAPGAGWQAHVLKGGNEVRVGDVVWFEGADGTATASPVIEIANVVRTGLYNPLTLGGTILVDGVAASAHSDWFLDGLVSADTQGKVYQAMFLPVRAIYHLIGPSRMETVAERWGVVDFVREATTQRALRSATGWGLAGLAGLSLALGGVLWWRRRAAVH
jgi:desert hedgehog